MLGLAALLGLFAATAAIEFSDDDTPDPAPTDGDDTLAGSDGPDLLDALAGDDLIHGGSGSDTLLGGPGDDWLDGAEEDDLLLGGADDELTAHDLSGMVSDSESVKSVCSKTLVPASRSEGSVNSFGLWLIPLTLGVKTIPVGQTRANICASWPAPAGRRRTL